MYANKLIDDGADFAHKTLKEGLRATREPAETISYLGARIWALQLTMFSLMGASTKKGCEAQVYGEMLKFSRIPLNDMLKNPDAILALAEDLGLNDDEAAQEVVKFLTEIRDAKPVDIKSTQC